MSLQPDEASQRYLSRLIGIGRHPVTCLVASAALYPLFLYVFGAAAWWILPQPKGVFSREIVNASAAFADFLVVVLVMERGSLGGAGFRGRNPAIPFGLGALGGAALISTVILFMTLAGWYRVHGAGTGAYAALHQGAVWTALLLAAVAEEILFRALGFRLLEACLGTWPALLTAGVFFGYIHGHNPGSSFTSMLGIGAAGLMLGSVYAATRNLWFVIGLHWSWNLFEGPIYGVPVSGYHLPGLLESSVVGPEIWTGGAFGPEASASTIVFMLVVTTLAMTVSARNGEVRPGPWRRRLSSSLASKDGPDSYCDDHNGRPAASS